MRNVFHNLKDFLLDLVFPRECVVCGSDESYLCWNCAYKTRILQVQACPVCARINANGVSCCGGYLDQLLVAADYHNNAVMPELIHLFKYKFAQDLAPILAFLLFQIFQSHVTGPTLITHVPLSKERFRYRGFNQAALLSFYSAHYSGLKHVELLNRIRHTKAQAGLSKRQREKNLRYAFWAGDCSQIDHVTLIDDVYTTGSTMQECAATLKRAGVKRVTALVLARSFR